MDAHSFEIGDGKNGDVQLQFKYSQSESYFLPDSRYHSHVLNKSKHFQARPRHTPYELTLLPNTGFENYIKCIRLMYSSYNGTGLYFSGVDEALDILPVASQLLFEEGIQACTQYLEAVPWTPQQTFKLKSLLSSPQVSVSADLSARLGISNSSFSGELELLKQKLPEMFSIISRNESWRMIPLSRMRLTVEQHLTGIFQGNESLAMQEVCRDAILNECKLKIEGIKNGYPIEFRDSACETLLWLLDVTKLCNRGMFETALKMFVEDSELAEKLFNTYTGRSFSCHLLEILVDRYMKGFANGDIIIPKSCRISFLRNWAPVMAYLIFQTASSQDQILCDLSLEYSERFVEGVTKVVSTIPLDDQKAIIKFCTDSSQRFRYREKEAFLWFIDVIWLAVTRANSSCLGTK